MSVTTDFVPSDCIFKAFDNIQLKHPDISQKDCLDMSVNWCEKRQSDFYEGKDFDCQEYQDMIHPIAEEIVYLETTIEHCNWIVQDVEDFIVQDAVRGAGAESFHRGGKRPGAQKGSPGALTGSAKRQFQKKEPRAKEILKKVPELFEVGSPEQYVKVMGELVPVPELSNGVTTFKGRAGLPNIPMTPVASSVVQGRAVRGMNLYVKFHSSPNEVYKYNMGSNELAQQAFDEMAMASPGRYVWNNLRGRKLGPVFGKPNEITPGGTTGSIVPYDKSKYTRVKRFMNEVPEFEELAAKMRKFKMAVKAEGEGATSGEPFSQAELKSFQDKMRAEIEDRTKTLEEIREALKKKGAKSMEGIVSQLPDLDFSDDNLVKINNTLHDIFVDLVDESEEWNKAFTQEVNELNKNITLDGLKDFYHDVIVDHNNESDEWYKGFVDELYATENSNEFLDFMHDTITDIHEESKEWMDSVRAELDGLKEPMTSKELLSELLDTANNYPENLQDDIEYYLESGDVKGTEPLLKELLESSKDENYDIASDIEYYLKKAGKGRGWWGDSKGHSEAAKKGRKDLLTEDIELDPELKGRVDKYQKDRIKDRERYEASQKRKKNTHIKAIKIVHKKVYHAKCSTCGRQLKKAVETNEGVMGYRCFLNELGVPPSPRANLSFKDLPSNTFEDLADSLIEQIKNLTNDDIKVMLDDWMGDSSKIEYAIRTSAHAIQYKIKGAPDMKRFDFLDRNTLSLAKVLGVPTDILDKIARTEKIREFQYTHDPDFKSSNVIGDTDLNQREIEGLQENIKNLVAQNREHLDEYDKEPERWRIQRIKQNSETIKEINQEIDVLKGSGKGRGWHGEPERHSTAALKGKTGITGDLYYTEDSEDKGGRWITVHGGDDNPETAGTHVFIKKGQTAKEAIDKKFKGKSGKKDKPEAKKPESKKESPKEKATKKAKEKGKSEVSKEVEKEANEKKIKKLKKELKILEKKDKSKLVDTLIAETKKELKELGFSEEKKEKKESKQTKKMPKGDPKKDDPDKPPKGHYIDEKSGKLKKTEAQKAKEGKEKATAEKKQLSKSEKQAKLKELGDELKKNKRKMNTQAAGTIIELLIKLLQTGSAQDTYAEFKRIRRKNSVMISKDVRLRKSIDKVEKQLKSFDFIRKQDLMDDIYDLELQLITQGYNIEQIREDFEQWEN